MQTSGAYQHTLAVKATETTLDWIVAAVRNHPVAKGNEADTPLGRCGEWGGKLGLYNKSFWLGQVAIIYTRSFLGRG